MGVGSTQKIEYVAPHIGAWIEIATDKLSICPSVVAPHIGAWIEIRVPVYAPKTKLVAPHIGAWIEIHSLLSYHHK